MKKIISLVLVLITLLSLAVPANAALVVVYTDSAAENTLVLPSRWTWEEGSSNFSKVKFFAAEDGAFLMTYGSLDLYSSLDASTRSKCSRSDVNNDLFDKEDIAEALGVKASEVTMTTINGIEYFLAKTVKHTTYQGYSLSVDAHYWVLIHNGWMYLYQYMGNVTGNVYKDYKSIISSANYDGSFSGTSSGSSSSGSSEKSIYSQAVEAYNDGKYSTAQNLFKQVSGYSHSADYLRLIRIRTYGENVGIGCVYDFRKGLTDSEKADIDAAARNFSFADTAEVLLCNTDVATYYLFGNWNTAANVSPYSYLRWHKDSAGGYYYTRSNNVSTLTSDCVSINDGYVRISITSSNTLVFHIKLTGPNSMSLYCYEYGKCVELFRQ